MSETSIGKTTDFASGLILGVYLFAVVYQGNVKPLYNDALGDYGYLEWLLAVVLLYAIYKTVDNKLVAWIIILGVIGVLLKMSSTTSITDTIASYAKGKTGLFQSIANISPSKQLTKTNEAVRGNSDTNVITTI